MYSRGQKKRVNVEITHNHTYISCVFQKNANFSFVSSKRWKRWGELCCLCWNTTVKFATVKFVLQIFLPVRVNLTVFRRGVQMLIDCWKNKLLCVVFVVFVVFSFTEEITYLINGANQNALLLSKAKLEDETSFGWKNFKKTHLNCSFVDHSYSWGRIFNLEMIRLDLEMRLL